MWFNTNYRANWAPVSKDEEFCRPGSYGTQLWANNMRHAKIIASVRGMGEQIVGE